MFCYEQHRAIELLRYKIPRDNALKHSVSACYDCQQKIKSLEKTVSGDKPRTYFLENHYVTRNDREVKGKKRLERRIYLSSGYSKGSTSQ